MGLTDATTRSTTRAHSTITSTAHEQVAPSSTSADEPPVLPTVVQHHRSWFERLSYAAVMGVALSFPMSRAQAQVPSGPPSPGTTTARLLIDERAGTTMLRATRAELPSELAGAEALDQLYHGALQELRTLYQGADKAQLQALAGRVTTLALGKLTASWQPHERASLERVMSTLGQLAGSDGHFNYGDRLAVTQALVSDHAGILRMAHQQIDERVRLGNRVAHRFVDNAYTPTRHYQRTGHAGLFQRMRDNRREHIQDLAATAIQQQLGATLQRLGVDPRTAQRIDPMLRNLTVDQVAGLERDLQAIQPRLAELAERLRSSRMGPVVEQMTRLLREHTVVTAAPLRNGVPNPNDVDAIIRTALDALEGVHVTKDIRAELIEVHGRAVQTLRTICKDTLTQNPAIERQAQRVVDAALARATAQWTPAERGALQRSCDTLDQLAGGDGRFNYGDKLAVVEALVKGKGPVERVVVGKVVGAQLDATLARLGVNKSTTEPTDPKPRELSVTQLKQLDADLALLKDKLAAPTTGAADDTMARVQAELRRVLGPGELVSPLRNGVPSPRKLEALIDTALDALDSFRPAPPSR
ncbi:MAG: hypothetical protein IT383_28095 [Deltaproteobacteria bacterium]|nr:hypothetical protein [Deltaproteobacteria bacterium]